MALNFGTYRLLPMFHRGGGPQRFEFFGHGIVELARLTTGKSTREIEEIAEFLIHAGYDSARVDSFLAPLLEARKGHAAGATRPYTATIDDRGELINEGIVLTTPFLAELERDIEGTPIGVLSFDGVEWLVFALEPQNPDTLHVGLRLGVARLKGWRRRLVGRRCRTHPQPRARGDGARADANAAAPQLPSSTDDAGGTVEIAIPELLVVTYLDADRGRQ
jgi:hypothetical protein